jgi:hypothetical protein
MIDCCADCAGQYMRECLVNVSRRPPKVSPLASRRMLDSGPVMLADMVYETTHSLDEERPGIT